MSEAWARRTVLAASHSLDCDVRVSVSLQCLVLIFERNATTVRVLPCSKVGTDPATKAPPQRVAVLVGTGLRKPWKDV